MRDMQGEESSFDSRFTVDPAASFLEMADHHRRLHLTRKPTAQHRKTCLWPQMAVQDPRMSRSATGKAMLLGFILPAVTTAVPPKQQLAEKTMQHWEEEQLQDCRTQTCIYIYIYIYCVLYACLVYHAIQDMIAFHLDVRCKGAFDIISMSKMMSNAIRGQWLAL